MYTRCVRFLVSKAFHLNMRVKFLRDMYEMTVYILYVCVSTDLGVDMAVCLQISYKDVHVSYMHMFAVHKCV